MSQGQIKLIVDQIVDAVKHRDLLPLRTLCAEKSQLKDWLERTNDALEQKVIDSINAGVNAIHRQLDAAQTSFENEPEELAPNNWLWRELSRNMATLNEAEVFFTKGDHTFC